MLHYSKEAISKSATPETAHISLLKYHIKHLTEKQGLGILTEIQSFAIVNLFCWNFPEVDPYAAEYVSAEI